MGKGGGSSTTKTEVKFPPELMAAAKANLQIADEAAGLGFVPYTQGQTAGFSPQQLSAMQGADQAAAAFGMPNQMGTAQRAAQVNGGKGFTDAQIYQQLLGMNAPNRNTMGIQSFSAMPIYNKALSEMAPGQRALIASMVRNPYNADAAVNPAMPNQNFVDPTAYARNASEKSKFLTRRESYRKQGVTANGPLPKTDRSGLPAGSAYGAYAGSNGNASQSSSSKGLSSSPLLQMMGLPGYLGMYQDDANKMKAAGMSERDIMRSLQRRYDS